jgi:hypothetical protein
MNRAEAVEQVQLIGDRLEAILKLAAPALPEPELDYWTVFNALFDGSEWARQNDQMKVSVDVILKIEPLISFVESQILPIINSTSVEELKPFRERRKKVANVRN